MNCICMDEPPTTGTLLLSSVLYVQHMKERECEERKPLFSIYIYTIICFLACARLRASYTRVGRPKDP